MRTGERVAQMQQTMWSTPSRIKDRLGDGPWAERLWTGVFLRVYEQVGSEVRGPLVDGIGDLLWTVAERGDADEGGM